MKNKKMRKTIIGTVCGMALIGTGIGSSLLVSSCNKNSTELQGTVVPTVLKDLSNKGDTITFSVQLSKNVETCFVTLNPEFLNLYNNETLAFVNNGGQEITINDDEGNYDGWFYIWNNNPGVTQSYGTFKFKLLSDYNLTTEEDFSFPFYVHAIQHAGEEAVEISNNQSFQLINSTTVIRKEDYIQNLKVKFIENGSSKFDLNNGATSDRPGFNVAQLQELLNNVELIDLFPDSSSFQIPSTNQSQALNQIHSYDNAASFAAWLIFDNFLSFKQWRSISQRSDYTLNIKYIRCVHEMEGYKTFQFSFSQEWTNYYSPSQYIGGASGLSCAEYIGDSYSGSNFVVATTDDSLSSMIFCAKTLFLDNNSFIFDSARSGTNFDNKNESNKGKWFSFWGYDPQSSESLIRNFFQMIYPNSTWYLT